MLFGLIACSPKSQYEANIINGVTVCDMTKPILLNTSKILEVEISTELTPADFNHIATNYNYPHKNSACSGIEIKAFEKILVVTPTTDEVQNVAKQQGIGIIYMLYFDVNNSLFHIEPSFIDLKL